MDISEQGSSYAAAYLKTIVLLNGKLTKADLQFLEEIDPSSMSLDDQILLCEALYSAGQLSSIRPILASVQAELRAAELPMPAVLETIAGQLRLFDFGVFIAPRRTARTPLLPGKVMSVYHSGQPFHTSGYAMRTQFMLQALQDFGTWDYDALTRPGYPWDVRGVRNLPRGQKSQVESVTYFHTTGDKSVQTNLYDYIHRASVSLKREIMRRRPSIVTAASGYVNALPALMAARHCGVPFVFEMRGIWSLTSSVRAPQWINTERYALEREFEHALAREADGVIAISEGIRKYLIEEVGVSADKIVIAPNAADIKNLKNLPKDKRLVADLGLDPNLLTVGYIGSFVSYEGLSLLVEACGRLYKDGLNFNLVLVGDGKDLPKLRARIEELGLEDRVILPGRIPADMVSRYYSIIDIAPFPRLPLPVTEYVTPLKPLESMFLEKLSIGSSVGGVAELIKDNVNGLIFEAGNLDALTAVMRRAITEYEELSYLRKDAKTWVLENRSWEQNVETVEALFARLVPALPETSSEISTQPGHMLELVDSVPRRVEPARVIEEAGEHVEEKILLGDISTNRYAVTQYTAPRKTERIFPDPRFKPLRSSHLNNPILSPLRDSKMHDRRVSYLGGDLSLDYTPREFAVFPVTADKDYVLAYNVTEAPLAYNRAIIFLDFPGANIVGKEVKLSTFKNSKTEVFSYVPEKTGIAEIKFKAPAGATEVFLACALWGKTTSGSVLMEKECTLTEVGGPSRRNIIEQSIKTDTKRFAVSSTPLTTSFECEPKERLTIKGQLFGSVNRAKTLIMWMDFLDAETGLSLKVPGVPFSGGQKRHYVYLDGDGVFDFPFVSPDRPVQLVLSFQTWSIEKGEKFEISEAITLAPVIRRSEKLFLNDDRTKKSIILYGDVDLNFVDGSGVWLTSVATVLSMQENVNVYLLLKRALVDSPFASLLADLPNLHILDGTILDNTTPLGRLENADERILQLDYDLGGADRIIVRGMDLNYRLAKYARLHGRIMPYLTDIPQTLEEMDPASRSRLELIYRRSAKILVQSEWKLDFLSREFPSHAKKMTLLPPMLPDELPSGGSVIRGIQQESERAVAPTSGRPSIVYAGKMAPDWGILELFQTMDSLRDRGLDIELHVIGDKISKSEDDPLYHEKVFKRLSTDPNIVWHKALKREVVLESLGNFDVGWCWRNPDFENNNKELSTKLLEYGISKLPTILTGTNRYSDWLGPDYKCLAYAAEDLTDVTYAALTDAKVRKDAIRIMHGIAQGHKISNVASEYIAPALADIPEPQPRKTILFAGHDFKFVGDVEAAFIQAGYRVIRDIWRGHSTHDPQLSHYLLEQADIVFCEWALGNLNWYAENISEDQRLFTRLHAQELHRVSPKPVNWDKVDGVIFVGDKYKRKAQEAYGLPDEKCVVIGNVVNVDWFSTRKSFNPTKRLGILGIVPKLKRLDLAIDILEEIRKTDPEFSLSVKGKMPTDYHWVRSNEEENDYYLAQMRRLARHPELAKHVIFEPHDHDVPVWAASLDFILSTSDRESFHLAVCEAGSVGAQPVILPWEGSDQIYPKSWIVKDVKEAAKQILKLSRQSENTATKRRHDVADTVRQNFGQSSTCQQIIDFVEGN